MHIVIFTMNMKKGGTERVISGLCNTCLIHRYQVSVVSYLEWECEYALDERIHTYSLGYRQENSLPEKLVHTAFAARACARLMDSIQADLVLAFLPRPCLAACLMRRKNGIPVIGSYRSNPWYDMKGIFYPSLVRMIYDRADGFVFQTKQAAGFFHQKLRKKSVIIPNAVHGADRYLPYEGKRSRRIVSVGRFTDEKNYPLLLRAFAGLDKQYDDYTLWLYGRYDSRPGIRELAVELGISKRVIFAGQKEDLYHEICDACLFVLASRSEGMPNALMEAMAMGLPVIATDCPCGGPRMLIQNGVNGILVPNEDENALIQAMHDMLRHPERAARLARHASDIRTTYNEAAIYRQWDNYLKKVYAQAGKGSRSSL